MAGTRTRRLGRTIGSMSPAPTLAAVERPWRALVAQWREQRFPKPRVAGSIPAGGTRSTCTNGLPDMTGEAVVVARLWPALPEQRVGCIGGRPPERRDHGGVGVHRERDARVSESLADGLRVNARGEQLHRVGVSQVAEARPRQLELPCQATEVGRDRPWRERCSRNVIQDHVVVGPRRAVVQPPLVLILALPAQERDDECRRSTLRRARDVFGCGNVTSPAT